MRIAVLGASGRVGQVLCERIGAAPDLDLAEGIASGAGTGIVALADASLDADMLIDFSTPDAVMQLLDRLQGNPLPLVIGTTGFTPEQAQRLRAEGLQRPLLIGPNFTFGFEPFRRAAMVLAEALPQAALTVAETYNAAKKPIVSGTTQGLVADLGVEGRTVATEINREGQTPGINTIRLDLGVAEITLTLTVGSRAAYAVGAIAAARWLQGRLDGAYSITEM